MDARHFDYHLTLGPDVRVRDVLHALIAHTAVYAGCPPRHAAALAGTVGRLAAGFDSTSDIEVACHRQGGPIVISVSGAGEPRCDRPERGRAKVTGKREGKRWVWVVTLDV